MLNIADFPGTVVESVHENTVLLIPPISVCEMAVLLADPDAMAEFCKRCMVIVNVGAVPRA